MRHARPQRRASALCTRIGNGRDCGCLERATRWSFRCYSDRDQHDDRPYSGKGLRECYRQGPSLWPG